MGTNTFSESQELARSEEGTGCIAGGMVIKLPSSPSESELDILARLLVDGLVTAREAMILGTFARHLGGLPA